MAGQDPLTGMLILGPVPEESSSKFTTILDDEADNFLTSLDTITVTLFDRNTQMIINSRDMLNVLNVNGGAFDTTTGTFTWNMLAADNIIFDQTKATEEHILRIDYTYTSSSLTRTGRCSSVVRVINLERFQEEPTGQGIEC